ncbi:MULTISPECIES: hypothetical protein [unclassified Lysinibacillus]|uniref:hypothetical protein n=1 Tax=unclassified Lysinibacillus TaxID=2636778 RepID=UPI001F0D1D07|nr:MULTISPECIES: hypothetical protein [unclassified Lysinibacillus]
MDIEQLIDTYSDYLYRIAYIYTKDRTVAICVVVYGVLVVRKILPLTIELEKKDEFLW